MMVDTKQGKILDNDTIKAALAAEHPYTDWLNRGRIILNNIKSGRKVEHSVEDYDKKLQIFGYGREDITRILVPMSRDSVEPLYAMGDDTPLSVLSAKPQRFFNYFK